MVYILRRCMPVLCFVCFVAWWVLSVAGILLSSTPSLAPRLAEFLGAHSKLAFLVWIVLALLWRFLHPPRAYGYMPREQRHALMRAPLTRLTGRSAVSLTVEFCILIVLLPICVFVFYLAVLDLVYRGGQSSFILFTMGIGAFYVGWLAQLRLHRFIYPM
jgi:hypothetical protein